MAGDNHRLLWAATWALSVITALGGGIAIGEAGKEREFREKLRAQREKEDQRTR